MTKIGVVEGGVHWAVQAKCYSPDHDITKHDVDKFLSESNRPLIQHRMSKFALRGLPCRD